MRGTFSTDETVIEAVAMCYTVKKDPDGTSV